MSITSIHQLNNPETTHGVKIEGLDPVEMKVNQGTFIFQSAISNQWTQILSYERPLIEGDLPITCKYQYKQIAPDEIKIWVKLNIKPNLQVQELRLLLPLFNIKFIEKVSINCSAGTLTRHQHPTEGFSLLLWTLAIASHESTLPIQIELSGSIFIGFPPNLQESLSNPLQNMAHSATSYDPQYEDILLRSFDQLLQQSDQELKVETSDNYHLINKEALNVNRTFQDLKTGIASLKDQDEDIFKSQQIFFTEIDQEYVGFSSSLTNEELIRQVHKKPQYIDKQTYLSLYLTAGNLVRSDIEICKILFYPHRDGIQIQQKAVIETVKFIIWNSLSIDE